MVPYRCTNWLQNEISLWLPDRYETISSGYHVICGNLANRTAFICSFGALSDPMKNTFPGNFTQINVSEQFCAITNTSLLLCWGNSNFGEVTVPYMVVGALAPRTYYRSGSTLQQCDNGTFSLGSSLLTHSRRISFI